MCSFSLEDKPSAREQIINLGLRLGGFYSDAGCYVDSQKILERCKELCLKGNDELSTWRRILDCCRKWVTWKIATFFLSLIIIVDHISHTW